MLADQIRMHESFGSTHLEENRSVLVYVPPGYAADAERRYPVLYMNDGQNLVNPEDAFGGVARSSRSSSSGSTTRRAASTNIPTSRPKEAACAGTAERRTSTAG
jgi:predicted alpha/beta superfamily hydrolase